MIAEPFGGRAHEPADPVMVFECFYILRQDVGKLLPYG